MRTTISPDLWMVYIENEQVNTHCNIKTVEKVVLRRKKAKNGQNELFHLLQNAPTHALTYHDFQPTSTHAHNYITRSLDGLYRK